jgi:hypothetical protein
MSRFLAAPHLEGLKAFQRATVDHVVKRFYSDDPPARRFLVADETGLGKSLVARGVIAKSLEHLQDHDGCERIDVVYVCSNADIAEQNLKRLDVLDAGSNHHAARLTLLAHRTDELRGAPHPEVGKRVNLVAFTPGTSFDLGNSTGRAEERALLHIILCEHLGWTRRVERRAAAVVLQGGSLLANFERKIDQLTASLDGQPPDTSITQPFLASVEASGLRQRFADNVDALGRRTTMTAAECNVHAGLVGELRTALARAGVEALEPDLVILDEFQRFRHLLAVDDQRYREAAELARALFDYGEAKVLLLSATPYKAFTFAEEVAAGEDHAADLRRTLGFLADTEGGGSTVDGIVDDLASYRRAAVDGRPTSDLRAGLETSLTRLMCRTERPRLGEDGMLHENPVEAAPVEVDDIVAYAALRHLANELDAPFLVDYWKSTPYFVNFGDGYRLGDRLREALRTPDRSHQVAPYLTRTQHLDPAAVHHLRPVDGGNARMRHLMEDTVGRGWWQLLWAPPSAPYDEPGGPYAEPGTASMSKRLLFSSWTATPTAVASLISHEALRRIARSRHALDSATPRLDWRVDDDRPGAMTTLTLFWPSPALARQSEPFSPAPLLDIARASARATGAEPWYWTTILSDPGSAPPDLDIATATSALSGAVIGDDAGEHGRLGAHVELALALGTGRHGVEAERRTGRPDDLDETLDGIGRFAPGNIAYRCLARLATPRDETTELGRWTAAAVLAGAFRTLFNRAEPTLLLDQLLPETVYWRAVLQYCAWGNLEAVLDEYLHHLADTDRVTGLDDHALLEIAARARTAITARPSRYEAFDPLHPGRSIPFPSRFALRYGNKRATNEENARLPEIREAFNSPFWPFVLATTSIGQEGIDLHWWCHVTVHWNTPASPVDFEQREGRVHRYGGLAIRRNLAHHHRAEMLAAGADGRHPWDVAYEAGTAAAADRFGELTPHWITDGPTKIERHLLPYPLSHDHDRYRRLKDDLAVYRLTFGQPRQEDLADLLLQRGVHLDPAELDRLHLDLRPPRATSSAGESGL